MKVAVIGSAGQLGTEVCQAFGATGHEVLPLTHAEIEVTDLSCVRNTLRNDRLDVVVNCAAYVRVDEAEDDAESAFRISEPR